MAPPHDATIAALSAELAADIDLTDTLPLPLTLAHRQQAVSHSGSLGRVLPLLEKLESGRNVTIAVLGGSVSAGSSSRVRPDQSGLFHRKLHRWMQRRFPRASMSTSSN